MLPAVAEIKKAPTAYIETFLDELKVQNFSPNTLDAYARDLAQFAKHCPSGELDNFAAQRYVTHLVGLGLATASVHRKIAALRSFYDHLVWLGVVEVNPFTGTRLPKREQRLPDAPHKDVVQECLDSIPPDTLGRRDKALIAFLFGTGCRIAEALSLTLADLGDLHRREVRVVGKGNKERVLVVPAFAVEALRDYLEMSRKWLQKATNCDAVFLSTGGGMWSYDAAEAAVRKRFARVGVTLHPHMLRHAAATHLLRSGTDIRVVQEILSHKNLATTSRYAHVAVEGLHDAVDKAFQ